MEEHSGFQINVGAVRMSLRLIGCLHENKDDVDLKGSLSSSRFNSFDS